MISRSEGHMLMRDGARLFTRCAIPHRPRALVVIVHGLGDHSGRYASLTEHFVARGYAAISYDQRGHGQSAGRRGDIASFYRWVDDLHEFAARSRRSLQQEVPLYVVGHSLGGLVTLNYCADDPPVDGIILSAPAIMPTLPVPAWKSWLGHRLARVFPKASLGIDLDPRHLSRDEAAIAAHRSDPLITTRVTLRAGVSIAQATTDAMPLAYRIQRPTLVLQARGDRICSPEATRVFFEHIVSPRKKLCLYDGDFHEPFTDIVKERAFNEVTDWLDRQLAMRTPCVPVAPYTSLIHRPSPYEKKQ